MIHVIDSVYLTHSMAITASQTPRFFVIFIFLFVWSRRFDITHMSERCTTVHSPHCACETKLSKSETEKKTVINLNIKFLTEIQTYNSFSLRDFFGFVLVNWFIVRFVDLYFVFRIQTNSKTKILLSNYFSACWT